MRQTFVIVHRPGQHAPAALAVQPGTNRLAAIAQDRGMRRFGIIPSWSGPRERKTSYRALPAPMNR